MGGAVVGGRLMRRRGALVLACALGLPPATGALVFGLSGATDLAMGQPLVWAAPSVTLAEAVAMRDRSEIAGQILLGADPNIRYRMRDYLSAGRVVMVTPLEAALATGDIGLVESLMEQGATVDDTNRLPLRCFAIRRNADAIDQLLAGGATEAPRCDDIRPPW